MATIKAQAVVLMIAPGCPGAGVDPTVGTTGVAVLAAASTP
ncbi:MAG TPA: hypothetical protein VFN66_07045 [Burkholderiales bacterium]|nr:hypothetical protein [Burkholderiales bacterium]